MDNWLKKDLWLRIIKSLFVHTLVVISILITTNCRQQHEIKAVEEKTKPIAIEISGRLKREDVKLMQPGCHSMKVPMGTLVGDTVTYENGLWISDKTCMRIAGVLKMFDEKVMEVIREKVK